MPRSHTLAIGFAAGLSCISNFLPAADVSVMITDKQGKPIADAVVSLVPLDRPAPTSTPPEAMPEIVQSDEQFSPFITVIRTGTTVAFPNRDKVEHYLFSQSAAKSFQFPLYAPGKSEKVTFDKAGVVALGCDIHYNMLAYIVVVDTPWFSHTTGVGTASITGVPAGRYRADIWHTRLTEINHAEITITRDTNQVTISRQFELKPDQRARLKLGGAHGGYR